MTRPRTQYARSDDVNIAYQVYVPGWISNVEITWEKPSVARFFERLASFSRLILFERGIGLSDRDVGFPTLDDRMDDGARRHGCRRRRGRGAADQARLPHLERVPIWRNRFRIHNVWLL
jgi:hypothetical protein